MIGIYHIRLTNQKLNETRPLHTSQTRYFSTRYFLLLIEIHHITRMLFPSASSSSSATSPKLASSSLCFPLGNVCAKFGQSHLGWPFLLHCQHTISKNKCNRILLYYSTNNSTDNKAICYCHLIANILILPLLNGRRPKSVSRILVP